jgi:hypothetical protein
MSGRLGLVCDKVEFLVMLGGDFFSIEEGPFVFLGVELISVDQIDDVGLRNAADGVSVGNSNRGAEEGDPRYGVLASVDGVNEDLPAAAV